MTGREAALKALYDTEAGGAFCDNAVKKHLSSALSLQDRGLCTALVYGVTAYRRRLDHIISAYSSQRLKKLSPWIINILRMGIYQILFLDRIPDSAAVNESVKLARRYGHAASAGFVNGVLRTVAREGDVCYVGADLGVRYSAPDYLCELLCKQYGEDEAVKMLEAFLQPQATTVRVNRLKTNKSELTKLLEKSGVTVSDTEYEHMLKISGYGDISTLSEYRNGLFTPQDISAYLAAEEVGCRAGELVIDVCAAPGGKATQLAEQSGNGAEIIAFDLYPHKLDIINRNAARLGANMVKPYLWDSTRVNEKYIAAADRVLADVPCSGFGVIGKKPDIKWKRQAEDIEKIITVQKQILQASAQYLKPGGTLVYSTCTVNKDENEAVVRSLTKNQNFDIVSEKTIMPYDAGDGFYICRLSKGK